MRKADAILTADIQLLEQNPVARLDDFANSTQWTKLDWLCDLQQEHGCPVIHSGDLVEYWKSSPWLISKLLRHLPENFWTIYGNHDLPQHNLEYSFKSAVHTLEQAEKIQILDSHLHWGMTPEDSHEPLIIKGRKIIVWHVMTYQGKKPYPGCKDPKSAGLLHKYDDYDLILTGHNHKTFTEELDGRLLVNPGSIYRTHADQKNHKPCVFLWYADTNTVEAVYLPIEEGVISREHIERKEERDDRINSFIETLTQDWEARKDFKENIEIFLSANETKQSVIDIIYKALDDEKN